MKRYSWAASGDVNAFFGLMLDNVAALVLAVWLLAEAFNFPATFAVRYMIPGTAIGVLVGDLLFTRMAFQLARRSGRTDVTAMPLGIDTPSTFGMVFFVLGPAFVTARDSGLSPDDAARHAWHIGICALVVSGVFKLVCAAGAGWVRRMVPRAGLLGSLAAIALVLISFIPLMEVLRVPQVGLVSLAVILTTLVARIQAPFRIPGALAALLVGGTLFYGMQWANLLPMETPLIDAREALLPREWLTVFNLEWVSAFGQSLHYLPVVIPFALATVVGGIDCTESAAAAGDEYQTGSVVAVEAIATLVAGLCGGAIQTTPYIGHPAYKAMGGRAAYTLATAVVIGGAGLLGYFGFLYLYLPKPAILPILVFIGLEISSQSFHATPQRHYPAVVLACIPAMASLVAIFTDDLLGTLRMNLDELFLQSPVLAHKLQTVRMLSAGFIITSLLWASAGAAIIDRRLATAAGFFAIAAACSLFGVIHSPLPGNPLVMPFSIGTTITATPIPAVAHDQSPLAMAAAYGMTACLLLGWNWWRAMVKSEEGE